jgi:chemosensory pili system protein ChpA (sensor histidine kinase/response regulator)
MANVLDKTIMVEIVGEIEGYLPIMRDSLRLLTENINNKQSAKELYRLTHTIKGLAAMIHLDELSNSVAIMENVLDDISTNIKNWSVQLIYVMTETVQRIGAYCNSLHKGEKNGKELYQKTFSAFERIGIYPPRVTDDANNAIPDQHLFGEFTDGGDDESSMFFFQQLAADEKAADSGEDPDNLFGSPDDYDHRNPADDPGSLFGGADDDGEEIGLKDDHDEGRLLDEMAVIDPELQESFNAEAAEHLEKIGRRLNSISSSINGPTAISDEVREGLHSIRRSVHTLKGAAAVVGIQPVADWGHEFEDFLDWLHDDSNKLSPEIVTAMLDGADILEKLARNPAVDVGSEISGLNSIFREIIGLRSVEKSLEPSFPAVEERRVKPTHTRRNSRADVQRKTTKTLRVRVEKIEEVMRLSGDMAINLSRIEDSKLFMQSTLNELGKTLQRLKSIASSLEADYELAAIPHLRTMAGSSRGDLGTIDEFDTLEMDRYSELHILIRSLNETVVDLDAIRKQTSVFNDTWRLDVERQRRVLSDIQNTLQVVQMTPFIILANRLYRTVRESARATGKSVRLLIEGESMEMDNRVWDILADPLMHMLRNAVDHGVEGEAERLKANKPAQATIRIICSRRGNQFSLRLSDDGRGLDYDGIRSRASQLYPEIGVEQMTDEDLASLIFKEGFSIKTQVTAISGRGVGMDVVAHAVDRLNGSVEVLSVPNKGVEFIFLLPITVAQFPALLVRFAQQHFAVPMRDISRVFRLGVEDSRKKVFEMDGEMLSLLRPDEIMGLQRSERTGADIFVSEENPLVLAVDVGDRRGLLVTDAIIGKRDVIFKNLGSHLHNVPCVSGATIMGDGSLVPILNTEDLLGREKISVHARGEAGMAASKEKKSFHVLVADDSISVRKVLARLIRSQGWNLTLAIDGVDAMEKIRENKPDLVLLDIEMPRMVGFEVLQSLQSQTAYREIPVLMLTSRSAGKYRDKAAELGARGFVTKPFQEEELMALIRDFALQPTGKG